MSIQRALALAALILACVSIARATTTYGSQATLEASAPRLSFEGVDLTSFILSCVPNCSTITDSGTGVIFTAGGSSSLTVLNATTIHMSGNGNDVLKVTLPSNVLAFGAGIANIIGAGVQVQFTGDSPNASYSNLFIGGTAYYLGGLVGAGPISGPSYQLLAAQHFDLGAFEVGTAASTPETTPLLSMGAGLLLIAALKRRIS